MLSAELEKCPDMYATVHMQWLPQGQEFCTIRVLCHMDTALCVQSSMIPNPLNAQTCNEMNVRELFFQDAPMWATLEGTLTAFHH